METERDLRKVAGSYCRFLDHWRPGIEFALKRLRCGFSPDWRAAREAAQWLYWNRRTKSLHWIESRDS
jgi:hypothetical protein